MFGIGNKFGGARRSAPAEKSQVENSGNLVGARMTLGRAEKALQAKVDELTAASAKLAELEQIVGNKMADGEDASAEVQAMQAAESIVRQLKSAVTVAAQRQQEAESALKKSRTAEKRESLRALLVQLNDIGRRGDAQMVENGKLAAEAIHVIGEIKTFGDDGINKKLVDTVLLFRVKLLDTCEAMPGCWTGADLFKKRLPWSACFPTPDEADRVQ